MFRSFIVPEYIVIGYQYIFICQGKLSVIGSFSLVSSHIFDLGIKPVLYLKYNHIISLVEV